MQQVVTTTSLKLKPWQNST